MLLHGHSSSIVLTLLVMQSFASTMAFTSSLVTSPKLVVSKSLQRVPNSQLQLPLMMTTTTPDAINEDISTASDKCPLIQRDRYVATNRFTVRKGKEAKFEQRWATRKSRLATLEGFRYFHLMRRVKLEGDNGTQSGDTADETSTFGNYVSLTVWSEKKHFTAWRKGEAFKEAHGGTSIGAFVSTLLNSALLLKDPPRPAFYDGILTQSAKPDTIPETTPEGWRATMESNGLDLLPAECFVACNQFYIPNQNREAFEKRWADRKSKLHENNGFLAFIMLRRDASQKGHGTVEMKETEPTYVSTTIWKDRDSFNAWRTSQSFMEAHQGGKSQDSAPTAQATKMQPLWVKPPSPMFYEGTLVITQSDGV